MRVKSILTATILGWAILSVHPSEAQTLRNVKATWVDASNNEDGFILERKTGATGVFAEVTRVGANAVTATDLTSAIGNTYTYRVKAFNSVGQSVPSNEATIALLVPDPPGGLGLVLSVSTTTANIVIRATPKQ